MREIFLNTPKEDETSKVFDLRLASEDVDLDLDQVVILQDVHLDGRIVRQVETFWLIMNVETVLQMDCRRCLEPFPLEIRTELEQRYVAEKAGPLKEEEDDEETLLCDGERLEISMPLREALLLSIPGFPVCRENCGGLCPKCGRRVGHARCDCQEEHNGFGMTLGETMGQH